MRTTSSPLPQSFEELLTVYQDDLARAVLERMPPVYAVNGARRDPETTALLRDLFTAQYHGAKGIAAYLRDRTGAFLGGEPSVGKTITALATASLLHARRVLVVAPTHLLPKWRREIRETVPHAQVLDIQRIRDIAPAFSVQPREDAPVYVLLSRDQGKLGAPWRHVARQHYLKRSMLSALPLRVPLRDGAEQLAGLVRDDEGEPVLGFSCPRCGALLRDEPSAEEAKRGKGRRLWTTADFAGAPRRCPFCSEPLLQQHRLHNSPRGIYPLARYLARRYQRSCELVIVDEVHRLQARGTAQGVMLCDLGKIAPRALTLTATLMNGRASSLFYLLHRLSPEFRRQWTYRDVGRFVRAYGLREITQYEDAEEKVTAHGKRTKAKTVRTHVRELPGVSPLLLRHVLDRTVMFHLRDLGVALPPYREQAVEIALSTEQREAYQEFLDELRAHVAHGYRRRSLRLIGFSLQALLAWPDAPWRGEAIVHPETKDVIATIPALPQDRTYPKEALLVRLCEEARAQGRRVLVYCTHTRTRDITHRLQRLLADRALRTEILTANVAGRSREAWVERHAPSLDVLLTHPKLVGEGLDLIQFPEVIWMEPEYSPYTVRQASRRTWRIGQTLPVTVRFLVYRDTTQMQALSIVAKGVRAASMVDGDVLLDNTLADYGAPEFFLELAKMIVTRSPVPDLGDLLRDAASQEEATHRLLVPPGATLPDPDAAPAPRIREISLTHRLQQLSLFAPSG